MIWPIGNTGHHFKQTLQKTFKGVTDSQHILIFCHILKMLTI